MSTQSASLSRRLAGVAALALAGAVAACGGNRAEPDRRAAVEIRGTDPGTGAGGAIAAAPGTITVLPPRAAAAAPAGPASAGQGIVDYGSYQAAVARNGETVAGLAERVGLSASELAAYNGLTPTHTLRAGDELVLPSRPGGYTGETQLAAATPAPLAGPASSPTILGNVAPAGSGIETAPLPGAAVAAPVEPATGVPTASGTPVETVPVPTGPSQAWSPDIAAAAIDRSSGINADGTLGAPPSATDPVPVEPETRRELESPDLGQYQTGATGSAIPPATSEAAVAAVAAPDRPTLSNPAMRLRRPVEGPVAVGFNKGAGPARNDGVDFAAPAGAPVVAAADGEVALVSQSLGGLGTIVLLRHPNELLTVYGRIDGVTVQKGDIVQAGQRIGEVSNAAAPAEPRMHFEVRRGAESLDPMPFL